ncbi:MAG: MaoC/PaaZ C-terminal domain-containing protein [Pseudomonadales bacterium]|jgi:acyl dehydratase|nr:MaoC family dehydratase N-terminal domain-containing protein [Pseudomonadales bacterium]
MAAKALSPDMVGTEFEPTTVSWNEKDVMLYALGVGARPSRDLDFIYEGRGPKVLPTFAVIPGMRAMGSINKVVELPIARMLHGEQGITLHRPLPPSGELTMTSRISEIWDKGKAAVIGVTADFSDADGIVFSTHSTLFWIGGGGFGGQSGPSTRDLNQPPDRAPDHEVRDVTREEQGAIYRLSGDRVALHIDPEFAGKAGYDKPFMHGLCTYGFVGRAVLHELCGNDPANFVSLEGRFSERVEFEDEIITRIWVEEPGSAVVQAVTQDGKVALSQARARYRA